MKLRDLAPDLEAALTRMSALPAGQRPCVVVEAHRRNSGIFIQYYGSFERPLRLMACFNPDTREIPGFEKAATEWFGAEMVISPDETFGRWTKECPSVTRAVEHGMSVCRHVLMLDWDTELFIDEIVQTPEGGAHA